MRVLLVHPSPLMYSELYLRLEPLGLERVAAAIRAAGHEVRLLDLQIFSHADYWRELETFAPQAVAAMQSGEVDLAIVDLDLPPAHGLAEDGWDLVHLLRAASPTLSLILIAAESRPHTQAEAIRLGARLLEKPINPRELRTIVHALRPETAPA